jgi:membrane protease subunit HflK
MLAEGSRRVALFAEGGIAGRGAVRWGLRILVVLYLLSGFFIVRPQQRAVVQVFGHMSGAVLTPGLHYAPPFPLGRVTVVDAAQSHVVNIGASGQGAEGSLQEALMLTGDVNIAHVRLQVEYRITDPVSYLFSVTDPDAVIRATAESVMRDLMATAESDAVLVSTRFRMQEQARRMLQQRLRVGVTVVGFRVLDVKPAAAVMDSFLDVVSATEDRSTAINQARAYEAGLLPETWGDAARLLSEARAQEIMDTLRARGEAQKFREMQASYRLARGLTAFRMYLETVEVALKDTDKYIVDPGQSVEFRYKKKGEQTK